MIDCLMDICNNAWYPNNNLVVEMQYITNNNQPQIYSLLLVYFTII